MPPQQLVKKLVVATRNLLTLRRVHLEAKAAASSLVTIMWVQYSASTTVLYHIRKYRDFDCISRDTPHGLLKL
jgi:hypothetical protein